MGRLIRRILKFIALALIFLPEPVTTAFGVAILAGLMATSGKKRLSKFKNMDDLVKRSFNTDSDIPDRFAARRAAIFHRLKINETDLAAEPAPSSQPRSLSVTPFDNRRLNKNILHHTLNNSIIQFEAGPSVDSTGFPGESAPNRVSEPLLHTMKTDDFPEPAESRKVPAPDAWKKKFYTPDEIVLHTLVTPR